MPSLGIGHRAGCTHRQKSNPWLAMALASDVLPTSVRLHPWRLGFKQSSLSRIAQALQDHSDTHLLLFSRFTNMLLSPRPFGSQVSCSPSESWTLELRPPLVARFRLCVTRRTLSPHTAHDRGILWERSISPAPRCILHGQLCAFAGYLCTVSRPSPSGPSPCTRFSRIRTTMPYLTACRASELSVRVSPAYFPLSFPSLSGSPVFTMEDSNKML